MLGINEEVKHLTDNGGTQGHKRYIIIVRKGDLKPPAKYAIVISYFD